ncbi:MAG: DUF5989 family protein [Acidobacteriota bacterium]
MADHPSAAENGRPDRERFEAEARQSKAGLLREFCYYLQDNKRWWLTPIIVVLLLVSLLILLPGSAAAPFIYTLF